MATANKDTIYIDIDEEITGIIDKVRASSGKVVALVLPKRASVLQSIVNMKLLKRAADQSKKHLVLITTEAGLLPLAGAVGVYVAKTLQSKPEIPSAPLADDGQEETVSEESADMADEADDLPIVDGNKPVGELAGLGAAAAAADGVETLQLDNDEEDAAPAAVTKDFKPPKSKKNNKLHVPNFERFRLLLALGALLLILLIVGIIIAGKVLPKATITIKTDASNVNTSVNLVLSPTATALNTETNTVPAKQVTEKKTFTGSAPATGQKNNGAKATGSVTMSACVASFSSFPDSVPAGTGISANGLTYITNETTKFSHSGSPNGSCIVYQATSATDITAQTGGAKYNVDSANFSVAGRSDVSASGSANGGTDDIATVISQADIDSATAKINTESNTIKSDLQKQLQQANLYAITSTFAAGTPATTNSANVGDAVGTVTVTEVITYTMYGVHQSDLKILVDNNIKSQVDVNKQSILDEGLGNPSFTANGADPTSLTLATTGEVGPNINVDAIKQQAVGQKSATITGSIQNDPDVTSVSVHFSPFWVTTAPKNTSKITVNIAKPTTTAAKNATKP